MKNSFDGNSNVPGPGQYNNEKFKKDDYHYSIGTKLNASTSEMKNPGPGAYNHKSTLEVPSSKFGTSQRASLNPNEKGSPGPG